MGFGANLNGLGLMDTRERKKTWGGFKQRARPVFVWLDLFFTGGMNFTTQLCVDYFINHEIIIRVPIEQVSISWISYPRLFFFLGGLRCWFGCL